MVDFVVYVSVLKAGIKIYPFHARFAELFCWRYGLNGILGLIGCYCWVPKCVLARFSPHRVRKSATLFCMIKLKDNFMALWANMTQTNKQFVLQGFWAPDFHFPRGIIIGKFRDNWKCPLHILEMLLIFQFSARPHTHRSKEEFPTRQTNFHL